jgi:hypothetical protein
MPDTEIEIPGVGRVAFPDTMTEMQINAAATRLYKNANIGAKQPPVTSWTKGATEGENVALGSNAGLGMAAAGQGVPAAAGAAMEVATNPNTARVAAAAGRVIGGSAPIVGGGIAGGPIGALAGVGAAAKGAWMGGKTGWFTGKLAQQVAPPVAAALEKVAPYAQALSTLGGAQGVGDLAQMAEPERRDIGVMGAGAAPPQWMTTKPPDAAKLAAMPVETAVKTLTDIGWPEPRAKSYVTQMRKLFK